LFSHESLRSLGRNMGDQHSLCHVSENNKIDVTIAIQSLSGVSQDLIFAVPVEIDEILR
jgi:hypothetical protein